MADDREGRSTLGGIWTRVAARLRAELGEDLYTSWFARMEPEGIADEVLNVSVPTRFLRSWIKSHYVDQLTACCAAEYKGVKLVDIQVRTRGLPTAAQAVTPVAGLEDGPQEDIEPVAKTLRAGTPEKDRGSQLDHNLTFDSYVQGPLQRAGPCRCDACGGGPGRCTDHLQPAVHSFCIRPGQNPSDQFHCLAHPRPEPGTQGAVHHR